MTIEGQSSVNVRLQCYDVNTYPSAEVGQLIVVATLTTQCYYDLVLRPQKDVQRYKNVQHFISGEGILNTIDLLKSVGYFIYRPSNLTDEQRAQVKAQLKANQENL